MFTYRRPCSTYSPYCQDIVIFFCLSSHILVILTRLFSISCQKGRRWKRYATYPPHLIEYWRISSAYPADISGLWCLLSTYPPHSYAAQGKYEDGIFCRHGLSLSSRKKWANAKNELPWKRPDDRKPSWYHHETLWETTMLTLPRVFKVNSIFIVRASLSITAKSGFYVFLFLDAFCPISYNLSRVHDIFLTRPLRGLCESLCIFCHVLLSSRSLLFCCFIRAHVSVEGVATIECKQLIQATICPEKP